MLLLAKEFEDAFAGSAWGQSTEEDYCEELCARDTRQTGQTGQSCSRQVQCVMLLHCCSVLPAPSRG